MSSKKDKKDKKRRKDDGEKEKEDRLLEIDDEPLNNENFGTAALRRQRKFAREWLRHVYGGAGMGDIGSLENRCLA